MNDPHYNQNYTRDQIENLLDVIRRCVENGHYIISRNENREDNNRFIKEYNIREARQKEILLNISVEDFCHSLQNKKEGYQHEILYVFVPQAELYNALGEAEIVDIYVKFNIIDRNDGNQIIVISFHPPKKPFCYLFR